MLPFDLSLVTPRHYSDLMKHMIILALLAGPVTAHAQVINGQASILDGDSFTMTGADIRLHGIDAPEGRQTCQRDGASWACGEEAASRLRRLVEGKQVHCTARDKDRYGRMVATCEADGIDLAGAMVSAGLAVALPEFSGAYLDAEARAKKHRIGIWGSQFAMPAAYRAANPRTQNRVPKQAAQRATARPASRAQTYSSRGCDIKGNQNRKGQWIYHLPGMPYYDVTRSEEIFCSEAQAVAAGYRRAMIRQ